jgi:pimeloyl-ACP methyl ester carboxylesterase
MILIPGLACSGEVWAGTVAHFRSRYQLHILTLAGFAGQPAVPAPFLATVRDDVIEYIETQHLDHPVLVGHSLGGFLAFWIAATAPTRVGPVIAVDGVPFLSALYRADATVARSRPFAEQLRKQLAGTSREAYARQSREIRRANDRSTRTTWTTSPGWVPRPILRRSVEAMYELMTIDLRGSVAKIETPVLLLASDPSVVGGPSPEQTRVRYEAQVADVPRHIVVVAEGSRHFIMLDAPDFLFQQMDSLLAGVGGLR